MILNDVILYGQSKRIDNQPPYGAVMVKNMEDKPPTPSLSAQEISETRDSDIMDHELVHRDKNYRVSIVSDMR